MTSSPKTATDAEEQKTIITPDQCRSCDQVFPLKDLNPEQDEIVSTFDNEHYCTFSCMSEKK